MSKILLLGLTVLMMSIPSAQEQSGSAQVHMMNRAEFDLFLHDLERDSVRWINVASDVDVSSLKDLPYRKGRLMEQVKNTLHENLSGVQDDIRSLKKDITLTSQIQLLMDMEEAKSSMSDLAYDLDIGNDSDFGKFSSWLNNATNAFGEINVASLKLYGHLTQLSQRIDRQIDVTKVR